MGMALELVLVPSDEMHFIIPYYLYRMYVNDISI